MATMAVALDRNLFLAVGGRRENDKEERYVKQKEEEEGEQGQELEEEEDEDDKVAHRRDTGVFKGSGFRAQTPKLNPFLLS